MKGRRRAIRSDIAVTTVFDESSTMDYLHGDVVDGEHEAACDYEYARESRVLRAAAGMHIAKRLGELTAEQWRAEFQKATERLEEQEGKGCLRRIRLDHGTTRGIAGMCLRH
jgi:hypothetical protein